MLGLQKTSPGFSPRRHTPRRGRPPELSSRLGFLLATLSGHLSHDVRQLAANARWANQSQGGCHDRSD
jgi:hypothetical protein